MDNMKAAEKVKKLREQAKDTTLPQDVRNQLLDNANAIEQSMAKKSGVKMAKGGAVKKPMMYAKGGVVKANAGASVPPAQKKKK